MKEAILLVLLILALCQVSKCDELFTIESLDIREMRLSHPTLVEGLENLSNPSSNCQRGVSFDENKNLDCIDVLNSDSNQHLNVVFDNNMVSSETKTFIKSPLGRHELEDMTHYYTFVIHDITTMISLILFIGLFIMDKN
jgi:hypothetical protein